MPRGEPTPCSSIVATILEIEYIRARHTMPFGEFSPAATTAAGIGNTSKRGRIALINALASAELNDSVARRGFVTTEWNSANTCGETQSLLSDSRRARKGWYWPAAGVEA